MASGKTHDWITLILLPPVWLISRGHFHLPWHDSVLIVAGTFIGGFFLSPDLDTRSRPFYRWGIMRWIWWPYQWAIRHRSPLSHGLFIASWLRLAYLTAVLVLLYITGSLWLTQNGIIQNDHPNQQVQRFLHSHLEDLFWLGIGLWLGALFHIALDWLSTFVTRRRTFRKGRR